MRRDARFCLQVAILFRLRRAVFSLVPRQENAHCNLISSPHEVRGVRVDAGAARNARCT